MQNNRVDAQFIPELIKGNNIIWNLMYYDELVINKNYHLTLLKNADLLFYNTAQAVNALNDADLKTIETYYKTNNINPAFYLDPASAWIKPYLLQNNYEEIPEELENWWGIFLNEDIEQIMLQDYLKIPERSLQIRIIDPKNTADLNQFLVINQQGNNLPEWLVEKLRTNMQKRVYKNASNTLAIIYVNDIPAAISAIGIYNNIAYLSEAATIPTFQKLGLHTYLSLYLLKHAVKCGANFGALTCAQDSITNFTAKRAGLVLLFQREFYKKRP